MSEEKLKEQIRSQLFHDFDLLEEVVGYHSHYEKQVRIDFLAKAKPHLVANGFVNQWFGIECKWVDGVLGQTSKLTRTYWQAITYQQSRFHVNGDLVSPAFCLVSFPPDLDRHLHSHEHSLFELAYYAGVGRLRFYRNVSWNLEFHGSYAIKRDESIVIKPEKFPKIRAGCIV
jgi:hypothetical protein